MDSAQFIESMNSLVSTTRMRAARWAVENPELLPPRQSLAELAEREKVPQIQQVLLAASAAFDGASTKSDQGFARQADGTHSPLGSELAGVLQHELRPSIGLLRLAAYAEIPNFGVSRTNAAIEGLRQRIDGLARLVEAYAPPRRDETPLYEFLTSCVGSMGSSGTSIYVADIEGEDVILTDKGLLRLIIENALQNALDATHALPPLKITADSVPPLPQVSLMAGVSDRSFWITLTNRFVGTAFKHEDVAASGRTSKQSHLGLGTRVMSLAAQRLNYQISVTGTGGHALFSLRGGRYV